MYTDQKMTPMDYSGPQPDPNRSGHYHTDIPLAQTLATRQLYSFSASQWYTELSNDFLESIETNGSGIILVEHDHTHIEQFWDVSPVVLRLEIVHPVHGSVLKNEIHLSLSSVENMFTHKDLRGVVLSQYTSQPDTANDWGSQPWDRHVGQEPPNYPDDLTHDTAFVFVHGYNNNLRASRGGNAEMFKRMHVLGSRAKYIGVSWYGYQSQKNINNWLVDWGWKSLNYQINVVNAFATAEAFQQYVSGISKNRIVVGAHSLGNMMVSAAIQDFDLEVDEYFMINAAVSSEAYSTALESVEQDMVHRDWGISANAGSGVNLFPDVEADREQYEHLFTYNWHRLFGEGDSRRTLTWNGRFADVTANAYNFWSAGDRTFHAHPHANNPDNQLANLEFSWTNGPSFPRAWSLQEKLKGRGGPGVHSVGGWSFSPYYRKKVGLPGTGGAPMAWVDFPEQIPDDPPDQLIEYPYFRNVLTEMEDFPPPTGDLTAYMKLFDPAETESASDYITNATLLATFIPSKQLAMGGRELPINMMATERQFEMQASFDSGGWYNELYNEINSSGEKSYWDHGDFKTAALPYVVKLFEKFITLGDLK